MKQLFPLLALLSAVAPCVHAVQMEPLSIGQLTERSTLVMRGTVVGKSCQRDPQGRIYTRLELDVAEVWKGTLATNKFTVVQGGGILGNEKAAVSGDAEYGLGEEVVAFLVLNQRGEGVTLGLAQGKFQIWSDAKTGEKLARNLFHGAPGPTQTAVSPRLLPTRQRLTLAELKRRVQEAGR